MSVSTPGNYLTEEVDLKTVPPVKVVMFTERKRIKGVPGDLVGGKEVVAENPTKTKAKKKHDRSILKKPIDSVIKRKVLRTEAKYKRERRKS